MMPTIYILASLGAFVVLAVVFTITREIYRAIRQSYRVAYVYERMRGYRGVTAKMWWTAFKYEMTTGYSSLRVGSFEIPRDYRKKIRREW